MVFQGHFPGFGSVYFMGKVFGKIHMVAFTFLASLYVKNHKRKNDILIAHGFNAPFFKIDYLFLHGTMKGFSIKTNAPINSKNKVLFYLEKMLQKTEEVYQK